MRILMLGNSFIFTNNMPQMLADLTGAEVVHHTRGGARLSEQLNPNTKLGGRTQAALQKEKWDYVVLQEMSHGPITAPKSFFSSVEQLCRQIRANGAVPILFATWAYQRGGAKLTDKGWDYDEMVQKLSEAYRKAAQENNALIADVGRRFYEWSDPQDLYAADGVHPSELGSHIAAETIAAVIQQHERRRSNMPNTTKQALEESLKHMLLKKPLDKITIRDITEDCGISRMAFYYHFQDIYDLVEWACIEDASKALQGKKTYETWQEGLLQIFEAVLENKPFILNAYRCISREQMERFLYQLTYGLIRGVVEEQSRGTAISEEDKSFIAEFYKYSFVGVMLDWIRQGMTDDPQVLTGKISAAMRGSIANAIRNFSETE